MVKELKIEKTSYENKAFFRVNQIGDFCSPYLSLISQSSLWALFVTLFYGYKIYPMAEKDEFALFEWIKE